LDINIIKKKLEHLKKFVKKFAILMYPKKKKNSNPKVVFLVKKDSADQQVENFGIFELGNIFFIIFYYLINCLWREIKIFLYF
jgi:hypothetical protein